MSILSARRQYHQLNPLIECSTFLQYDIYKSPNKRLSLRAFYNTNQSLFLTMSPSTNTLSGPTASIKTLVIIPSAKTYLK